jgi:hypothetical protein
MPKLYNSLGAVVGVEDNRDTIDGCYAPDVVGCCNGSSNAGFLVLVYMVLVGILERLLRHTRLTVDTLSGEEGGLKSPCQLENFSFEL